MLEELKELEDFKLSEDDNVKYYYVRLQLTARGHNVDPAVKELYIDPDFRSGTYANAKHGAHKVYRSELETEEAVRKQLFHIMRTYFFAKKDSEDEYPKLSLRVIEG
jgi:hypothetical protein